MYDLIKSEKGYALASVLYMLTILSLLAASVISIKYLANNVALLGVAKVRCDYAVESGIAKALSEISSKEDRTRVIETHELLIYKFRDESYAEVEIDPWGALLRARVTGRYRKVSSCRSAIVAQIPDSAFSKALVFANASHQLVMTGNSSIKGDVVTGLAGATTGTLRDRTSPVKNPIEGKITMEPYPSLPIFDNTQVSREMSRFNRLLASFDDSGRSLNLDGKMVDQFSLNELPDSVERLFIRGNMTLHGKASRSDVPLDIIANGKIIFSSTLQLGGLIAVISASPIEVSGDVKIDQAILYSKQSVILRQGADISAQCIAPSIIVESNVVARYPSIFLSMTEYDPDSIKQEIVVNNNSRIEGFVGMFSSGNIVQVEPIITIKDGATVTGALSTDRKMTLDGTVIGTVLTRDFFFYEAPTTYLGWLRSGNIDRTALPKGFLIPIGYSSNPRVAVLDWL